MPQGIVIKGIGGFYYIKSGSEIFECKARGIFRKDGLSPLPGDRVVFSYLDEANKIGSLDDIMPRDNELIRPAVCNINQVAVVIAIKSPKPDLFLLDKMLVTLEKKKIGIIICINKIDLDQEKEYESIVNIYSKAGYNVILLNSKELNGFDNLEVALKDKITVFAGQSGVGKSTILNAVMQSVVMETGEVSEKIERGRHTTRHAELCELKSGGFIVDTPGFSSFELDNVEYNDLETCFPEFKDYLYKCKYTGCSHITEPDCSIKGALESGNISVERYNRYCQIYSALKLSHKTKYSR